MAQDEFEIFKNEIKKDFRAARREDRRRAKADRKKLRDMFEMYSKADRKKLRDKFEMYSKEKENQQELDAQVWATPYVLNTACETKQHLLKLAPRKKLANWRFPVPSAGKAEAAARLIREPNVGGRDVEKRFKCVVNERKAKHHDLTLQELRNRVAQCCRLFKNYPTLRANLGDAFFVIQNFENFVESFLGRHLRKGDQSGS